ncbi:uncharacterized protein LOC121370827 [Gigantopelta aegis]|uniref:uncharacterized protein LOC121370827 n=1 Tax=Gigantopelta aegis TaxID=1735272 RepID=UPI001B88B78C|nr:uncharacterized protein LOC121370827 [Gigantopelta aegis]XP_041352252.1 uncharacterized protein LOC121370827 [Gigantopelta aegis]
MTTRGILKFTVPLEGRLIYPQADDHPYSDNRITFQHMTPRRKIDPFGRDATNASDFFLSAAVYPTGVRAPPLAELQQFGHLLKSDDMKDSNTKLGWTDDGAGPVPKILTLKKYQNNNDVSTEQKSSESIQAVDMLTRLKPYHWDGVNGLRKSKSDVRDPCYIYQYCADERPLRYNKNSNLPRISSSRPWSVGESNPSKHMFTSGSTENRTDASPAASRHLVKENTGFHNVRKCRPFKPLSFRPISESDLKKPLLEVRHISTRDQRNQLKGQDGCLFSQVKQCIRLMRNHDAMKARTIDRPLKAEVGRYRPFSTTKIRTPCMTPPTIAHFRDHNSAETYKQYVQIQTLKSKLPGKSAGTLASGNFARNNTAASMYYDVDAHLVQTVIDSNIPPEPRKLNMSRKRSDISLDTKTPNDQRNIDLDIVGTPISSTRPRVAEQEEERDASRKPSGGSRVPEGSMKSFDQPDVPAGLQEEEDVDAAVNDSLISLDELGNPMIWDQSDEDEEEIVKEDPNVIKIPAVSVASVLSVDDGDTVVDDDPNAGTEDKGC